MWPFDRFDEIDQLRDSIRVWQETDRQRRAQIGDLTVKISDMEARAKAAESEVAALKAPKPPPDLLKCPCGTNTTRVLSHVVGWVESPVGANPVALGAIVECLGCHDIFQVDGDGWVKARPAGRSKATDPDPGRKRATPDDDLKWRP